MERITQETGRKRAAVWLWVFIGIALIAVFLMILMLVNQSGGQALRYMQVDFFSFSIPFTVTVSDQSSGQEWRTDIPTLAVRIDGLANRPHVYTAMPDNLYYSEISGQLDLSNAQPEDPNAVQLEFPRYLGRLTLTVLAIDGQGNAVPTDSAKITLTRYPDGKTLPVNVTIDKASIDPIEAGEWRISGSMEGYQLKESTVFIARQPGGEQREILQFTPSNSGGG